MRPYKVIFVRRNVEDHTKTEYKSIITYANDKRKAVRDARKLVEKTYRFLSANIYRWH